MFWQVKFSDEFESKILQLKVEAEAWGRAKAIKEARDCGGLDESEKSIDLLVSRIEMFTLNKFSDILMNLEQEKDTWNKKTAFYRELPGFEKELQLKYRRELPTIVKEILAADQRIASEDPFLSKKKEETKIS